MLYLFLDGCVKLEETTEDEVFLVKRSLADDRTIIS
jgi:hypothetical protein